VALVCPAGGRVGRGGELIEYSFVGVIDDAVGEEVDCVSRSAGYRKRPTVIGQDVAGLAVGSVPAQSVPAWSKGVGRDAANQGSWPSSLRAN